MKKALLVRSYGPLTAARRKLLFPGWDVVAYGTQVRGTYDFIIVAFLENTQREIEWVEDAEACLRRGGHLIRTT